MRLHDALGISRGWVVHANTHGYDNGVDLDAVARSDGRYVAVVRLDTSDSASITAFFKWVTASVSTSSKSVEQGGKEVTGLGELPPPPKEIKFVV